jgi:hypothetical protein
MTLRMLCSNIGPIISGGNNFIENRNHFLDGKIFLRILFDFKHVQAQAAAPCRMVQTKSHLGALFGNVLQNIFHKIAVRIDNTQTFAVADILNGHVFHEFGFTSAGAADYILVATAIIAVNINFGGFTAVILSPKQQPCRGTFGGGGAFLAAAI